MTAFGDLSSPCGEGDASGATERGVTDTSITIGYGDDAGFQQTPGLSHELSDALKAMIDWCNDQGGINGREVVGTYHDAKLTEVVNAVAEACVTDFMLVGQGWSLDASQEEARRGCDLGSVPGFAVSPSFANAPLMVSPVPNPVDYTPVGLGEVLKEKFPDAASKTSVMYGNYPATTISNDKAVEAFTSIGYTFLPCPQQFNVMGEADWKPFVQQLQDCGAEMVLFTGTPYPYFENVLDAAAQIGYEPIWVVETNFYDAAFAAWNTSGHADNVYMRNAYVPLEEAAENPVTQQFIDIVEKTGGDISQLGEQAASAFLLWATATKACGSDVTTDCVMAELNKIKDWTAGGLHAATDPGSNIPPTCTAVLKLNGTSFERVHPSEPGAFDCDDSYVAQLRGPVVQQANLGPDRIAPLG